jgi:flagellar hook-length control protein FliK
MMSDSVSIGVTGGERSTVRGVGGAQPAATPSFAELLAAPNLSAAVPDHAANLLAELAALLESTEAPSTNEYSPEGWLEMLALALAAPRETPTRPLANGALANASGAKQEFSLDVRYMVRGAMAGQRAEAAPVATASATELTTPPSDRQRTDTAPTIGMLQSVATGTAAASVNPAVRALANEPAVGSERSLDDRWLDDLSALTSGSQGSRATGSTPEIALRHPVGTPAWQTELATRVTLLVRGADQSATLTLNPRDLGPVEVRIAVREGEASVQFAAIHPEARAALEAALPRLRELLAAQGLLLADSSIGQQFSYAQGQSERGSSPHASSAARAAEGEAAAQNAADERRVIQHSLLDLYA